MTSPNPTAMLGIVLLVAYGTALVTSSVLPTGAQHSGKDSEIKIGFQTLRRGLRPDDVGDVKTVTDDVAKTDDDVTDVDKTAGEVTKAPGKEKDDDVINYDDVYAPVKPDVGRQLWLEDFEKLIQVSIHSWKFSNSL